MKKEDEAAARTIIEPFNLVSILQAQDAFFGGRTDAIKLYHCVMNVKKFITSISLPSTLGPTRSAFIPLDIPLCSTNPREQTFQLLWTDEMQNSSTLRFLPSSLAIPQWWQTHFSTLHQMCGSRTK